MKKLTFLIFSCILSLSAISTQAAIDPQPDGVGVYFDTEASALCHAPGNPVTCYLMFTNVTGERVMVFVCAVDVDTNLPVSSLGYWVHYGLDIAGPEDATTLVKNFAVQTEHGWDLTGDHYIAAWRTMLPLSPSDFVSFRVFPNEDYGGTDHLYYRDMSAGIDTQLHVVNGNADVPQTFITSGDCVVANEAITWSQLKALY